MVWIDIKVHTIQFRFWLVPKLMPNGRCAESHSFVYLKPQSHVWQLTTCSDSSEVGNLCRETSKLSISKIMKRTVFANKDKEECVLLFSHASRYKYYPMKTPVTMLNLQLKLIQYEGFEKPRISNAISLLRLNSSLQTWCKFSSKLFSFIIHLESKWELQKSLLCFLPVCIC